MVDGCRTLAMLWDSAWKEGNGDAIDPNAFKTFQLNALKAITTPWFGKFRGFYFYREDQTSLSQYGRFFAPGSARYETPAFDQSSRDACTAKALVCIASAIGKSLDVTEFVRRLFVGGPVVGL